MDFLLNDVEVRIIGSLIEKQSTTPENYPLSLNSLLNACNQLSNREPVVSLTDQIVQNALFELRGKRCARMIIGDGRVPKFEQILTEELELSPPEIAVMCVLMLRGPQTPGEIRSRTNRLFEFSGFGEVEETLLQLTERTPEPLVVKLPRQAGTKESRYAHLLSGQPQIETTSIVSDVPPAPVTTKLKVDRVGQLELDVENLRQELQDLKQQFEEFKKQFE